MAIVSKDLTVTQQQLYSRAVSFNQFRDITKEDIESILTLVKTREKNDTRPASMFMNEGLDRYIKTLQYLINPRIGTELKNIDEKLLYLILATDPQFKMFNLFLQSPIISKSDINNAPKEEQKTLRSQRDKALSTYENEVRKAIGFYDPQLLKYESILKKGLLKPQGFFEGVKLPSINNIIAKADNIENIDILFETNLERIKQMVERWHIEAKDPQDLNSLAYNILNNRELRLYVPEEQVLFFTLIADPDLKLLTIYAEECTQDKIKERALSEVGFISKGMIRFEKLYHDKYEPEKPIDSWTK